MKATTQREGYFDDQTLAMILIIIGALSYSSGYIYCNQNKFHPVQTSLVRGITVIIICYVLIKYYYKSDITFKSSHNFKWINARNSIMVFHNFVYTSSQFYLPLPIAITLNSISPIFVFIYDYFLYGVTINRTQVIFLFVSIFGVIITSNGSYLITFFDEDFDFDRSAFDNYQSKDPMVMAGVAILLIFTMMCHGYGIMITKKFVGVHTTHVNFNQGLLIFFTSAFAFPIAEASNNYNRMDFEHFLKAVLFSGIPMTIGQLSYIGALILTKNMGVITTLSFISIVLGFLISIFRYGQKVNPISTLGCIAIVVGITFLVRQRDKSSK